MGYDEQGELRKVKSVKRTLFFCSDRPMVNRLHYGDLKL